MIAVVGSFGLCIGLCGALATTGLWVIAARRTRAAADPRAATMIIAARQAGWLTLFGAALAVAAMEIALIGDDFSLTYVAENSSRATPLLFRITALWSALDGSLLLWLLILSGHSAVLAHRIASLSERSRRPDGAVGMVAAAVVSAVAASFFAVTLISTRPFARVLPAPDDGPGPNPLLADHVAMAVHPPLLYAGYLGLVVPFGYALAALITGGARQNWMTAVRRWVLAAWLCLTAGIALGAWWSYAVLGWGGYWAWDPVENASLLPWLTSTALLHAARRGRAASGLWTVTLAAASFLLVVTGTFLTRSGIVASVHSFTRSDLGPALLVLLLGWAGVTVALVILRGDRLAAAPAPRSTDLLSRGTALLLNNVLLVGLAITVLVGTLVPVASQAWGGPQLSVGAPYYNRIAVPVAFGLLVLVVLGTIGRRRSAGPAALRRRAALPAGVAAVVTAALGLSGARGVAPVLALGLGAAVVTVAGRQVFGVLRGTRPRGWWSRRSAVGGHLAHAGLAIALAGIAASSSWAASSEATIRPGGWVTAGGSVVQLHRVGRHTSDGRTETAAELSITPTGGSTRPATAALTYYPGRSQTVPVPAIAGTWRGDAYVTVLAIADDGSTVTLRVSDEPLVGWLWAGAAVMVTGGLLAFAPRRGVGPVRARRRIEPTAADAIGAAPDGLAPADLPTPVTLRRTWVNRS